MADETGRTQIESETLSEADLMLKVDPDTLYALDELRELLHGVVELPTFLDRLGLRERRTFRDAVWGWEIIEASRRAQPFSEAGQAPAAVVEIARRGPRGRQPAGSTGRLSARDLRDEPSSRH